MSQFDLSLYLVLERTLIKTELFHFLDDVISAGITMLQLREKSIDDRTFYELAIAVKKHLQKRVPLIINNRLDIAMAAKADGLHLGQSDLSPVVARKLLGHKYILGLSVENFEQFERSTKMNIDYISLSPLFHTTTKADISKPWELNGIYKIKEQSPYPVMAIGGINLSNAKSVLSWVDGIGVVSAICGSDDPKKSTELLAQATKKISGAKYATVK